MAIAILTRDDTSAYGEALAELGLETIAMPVTRTEPPADPDALLTALRRRTYDVAIATSPRGARALVDAMLQARAAEVPRSCWAVGPATAAVFREARRDVEAPAVGDAVAMLHAMLARTSVAGAAVLVVRPEIGREEAASLLRDAGATVDEVVAYRTVAAPADDPALAPGLAAWPGDVVCVFAPSQVSALAKLVPLETPGAAIVAIGQTTAAALRELGIEPSVAETPTPEGIAKAVAAVYPARR